MLNQQEIIIPFYVFLRAGTQGGHKLTICKAKTQRGRWNYLSAVVLNCRQNQEAHVITVDNSCKVELLLPFLNIKFTSWFTNVIGWMICFAVVGCGIQCDIWNSGLKCTSLSLKPKHWILLFRFVFGVFSCHTSFHIHIKSESSTAEERQHNMFGNSW